MHHYEVAPPPELRQVIQNFWHFRLDLGPGPASLEVLPDGYAEIIFYFGNAGGLTVQPGGPRLPSPFLMGLLDQPVRFTGSGWLDVVGIKCFPWTVFDLRWSRQGGQKKDVYFFCYGNKIKRVVARQTAQIRRGLQSRGPAPGQREP